MTTVYKKEPLEPVECFGNKGSNACVRYNQAMDGATKTKAKDIGCAVVVGLPYAIVREIFQSNAKNRLNTMFNME